MDGMPPALQQTGAQQSMDVVERQEVVKPAMVTVKAEATAVNGGVPHSRQNGGVKQEVEYACAGGQVVAPKAEQARAEEHIGGTTNGVAGERDESAFAAARQSFHSPSPDDDDVPVSSGSVEHKPEEAATVEPTQAHALQDPPLKEEEQEQQPAESVAAPQKASKTDLKIDVNEGGDFGDGGGHGDEGEGEDGQLPEPTGTPTIIAAPCLKGRIIAYGDGRHVCKGMWAMSKADHDIKGTTSRFEFSFTPEDPNAKVPANGTYVGFFWMVGKGGPTKYDDQCSLEFVPNRVGGWNIQGSGHNKFGSYQVCGTVTPGKFQLELYRLFDHLLHPPKCTKHRKTPSATSSRPPIVMRPPSTRQSHTPTAPDTQRPSPIITQDPPSSTSLACDSNLSPISHLTEASTLQGLDGGGVSPPPPPPTTTSFAATITRGDSFPMPIHPPSFATTGSTSVPLAQAKAPRVRKLPSKMLDDDDRVRPDRSMSKCMEIVSRMQKHHSAVFFNHPVDPIRDVCPDYYTVIKEPMDFGTLRSFLEQGQVTAPDEFASAMRLIFSNALRYNARPEHPVHAAAVELRRLFEEQLSRAFPHGLGSGGGGEGESIPSPKPPARAASTHTAHPPAPTPTRSNSEGGGRKRKRSSALDSSFDYDFSFLEGDGALPPPPAFPAYESTTSGGDDGGGGAKRSSVSAAAKAAKKKRGAGWSSKDRPRYSAPAAPTILHVQSYDQEALLKRIEALEKQIKSGGGTGAAAVLGDDVPLTYEEKRNLRTSIEKLSVDKAHKVIKIIQQNMEDLGQLGEDEEVEIDIDKLDTRTLRELQRFVASCMGGGQSGVKRPGGGRGPGRRPKSNSTSRWADDSDYEDGSDSAGSIYA